MRMFCVLAVRLKRECKTLHDLFLWPIFSKCTICTSMFCLFCPSAQKPHKRWICCVFLPSLVQNSNSLAVCALSWLFWLKIGLIEHDVLLFWPFCQKHNSRRACFVFWLLWPKTWIHRLDVLFLRLLCLKIWQGLVYGLSLWLKRTRRRTYVLVFWLLWLKTHQKTPNIFSLWLVCTKILRNTRHVLSLWPLSFKKVKYVKRYSVFLTVCLKIRHTRLDVLFPASAA